MAIPPMNLGPLPQTDRADDLQRLSVSAVHAAVPVGRFIFRDERCDDKGVDGSLEVTVGRGVTNLRAQLQIKSTDATGCNADGSYSLDVETSNLNYLLNGPSPLYLLWLEARREFRFAWARDEAKRLHRDNPGWQDQETVVIRFRTPLGPPAWDDIHDRVLREGRAHREVHDALTRSAASGPVAIGLDPETFQVTTSDQAYDTILRSGIWLTSAGYGGAVLRWGSLLDPAHANAPAVRLALGYAAFSLGDTFAARGHLGRVVAAGAALPDFDRHLLDTLVNECDHRHGRIDDRQYEVARREITGRAPPFLSLQLRLEDARRAHVRESDGHARARLLAELRRLLALIEGEPGAPESLKLHARIAVSFSAAGDAGMDLVDVVARSTATAHAGRPLSARAIGHNRQVMTNETAVIGEADRLCDEAKRLGHPYLVAEAAFARAVTWFLRVTQLRLFSIYQGLTLSPKIEGVFPLIANDFEFAVSTYTRLGNVEDQVKSSVFHAQFLEFAGDAPGAVSTALGVLEVARGMGYDRLAAIAESVVAKRSDLSQLIDKFRNPPDPDEQLAMATDASLRDHARIVLEASELPPDRAPVVERALRVLRKTADAKLSWCRHLDVLEDQTFNGTPHHYARDTTWVGFCQKHKTQSLVEARDGEAVLDGFKKVYCESCQDRLPKRPTPTPGSTPAGP